MKCLKIFDGIIKIGYSYNGSCRVLRVLEFVFTNKVIIESLYPFVPFQ